MGEQLPTSGATNSRTPSEGSSGLGVALASPADLPDVELHVLLVQDKVHGPGVARVPEALRRHRRGDVRDLPTGTPLALSTETNTRAIVRLCESCLGCSTAF